MEGVYSNIFRTVLEIRRELSKRDQTLDNQLFKILPRSGNPVPTGYHQVRNTFDNDWPGPPWRKKLKLIKRGISDDVIVIRRGLRIASCGSYEDKVKNQLNNWDWLFTHRLISDIIYRS